MLVTILLARTLGTPELTYVAVFHFVSATYLVLFSVGKNDPTMAYVLGLAAVIEAILLWCIGLICQRAHRWLDERLLTAAYRWAIASPSARFCSAIVPRWCSPWSAFRSSWP